MAAAASCLVVTACVSSPLRPGETAAPTPVFSAMRFFIGSTDGAGSLAIVAHGRRAIHVHGIGHVEADGTLILDQRVEEDGAPSRQRRWRMHETAPGRLAGTLSDAAGPVVGEESGNMLHLRFALAGGLAAEQRLYLQPDGRTALNVMTVRRLGLRIAVLHETIRKTG